MVVRTHNQIVALLLGLTALTTFDGKSAQAQFPGRRVGRPPVNVGPAPGRGGLAPGFRMSTPAVGTTVIRGIRYEDHSRTTSLGPGVVGPGAFFRIQSRTLRFNGRQDVRVILQDVRRQGGFGVTVFRLTNIRAFGSQIVAQAPGLPLFRNRTYHVTVFVYERGQRNRYASAGLVTVR